jgi:hypothetical protein
MKNPTIDANGSKHWYNEQGQLHRENGPAWESYTGSKYWYNNGLPHREDGPAIELFDGEKHWYINGKQIQ